MLEQIISSENDVFRNKCILEGDYSPKGKEETVISLDFLKEVSEFTSNIGQIGQKGDVEQLSIVNNLHLTTLVAVKFQLRWAKLVLNEICDNDYLYELLQSQLTLNNDQEY